MKKQLLDPLSTMVKLIQLNFRANQTKISIHDHVLILQDPTGYQWAVRWYNGDGRENIGELYYAIVRLIKWFMINESDHKSVDDQCDNNIHLRECQNDNFSNNQKNELEHVPPKDNIDNIQEVGNVVHYSKRDQEYIENACEKILIDNYEDECIDNTNGIGGNMMQKQNNGLNSDYNNECKMDVKVSNSTHDDANKQNKEEKYLFYNNDDDCDKIFVQNNGEINNSLEHRLNNKSTTNTSTSTPTHNITTQHPNITTQTPNTSNDKSENFCEIISKNKKFRRLVHYLCDALEELQKTYKDSIVALVLQLYINILNDGLSGEFNESRLPIVLKEEENQINNLLDYNKIKNFWNVSDLENICDLYENCFELSANKNLSDNRRQAYIEGNLQNIDTILSVNESNFQELIQNSKKG
jgi:hypothetical protein